MSNNKVGYIKFRDWHKTHSVHTDGNGTREIFVVEYTLYTMSDKLCTGPFFASSTMLDENLEIINDYLERIVAIAIKDRVSTLCQPPGDFTK